MKRLRLLVAGACLVSSGLTYGRVTVSKGGDIQTYDFQIEATTFRQETVEGKAFNHVVLEGLTGYEGIAFLPGAPQLPVVRFYVDGAVNIEATEGGDKATLTSDLPVVPSLLSAAKIAGEVKTLNIDIASYQKSQSAKKFLEVQTVGSVRGIVRQLVTLNPVSYDPETGAVFVKKAFKVTVKTKDAKDDPSILLAQQMVFVVGSQFVGNADLQAYIAAKQAAGFRTTVVNADDVGNDPDRLRTRLREVYAASQRALKYVVIVGDNEDVAAKPSDTIDGVTDHYFACLDTEDYDSDIGTPDVAVGRISVSNAAELKDVLAKLTKYTRNSFSQRAWLKKYSFLASDDPNYYQVAEGTHNYAIETYTAPKGFMGNFPGNPQSGGDRLYAVTHSVDGPTSVSHMKEGRGLINYGGHGGVTLWAAPYVNKADVLAMQNPDYMPVVVANACITGKFTEDSFAETWLRHKYGAVMYWGSMDSSYWDEDDILERKMYDGIFALGKLGFGAFTDYALSEVWRHYGGAVRSKYYMETYVLFGDPSMQMHLN